MQLHIHMYNMCMCTYMCICTNAQLARCMVTVGREADRPTDRVTCTLSEGVPRSFMISMRCCWVESWPWKGKWPNSNSTKIVPIDHMSTAHVYSVAPNMSSGAR